MEVIIQESTKKATDLAVKVIANRLRAKPHMVLGLATGRTMERLYERLVYKYNNNGLDFSLCKTYNLDEYVGLSPEDSHSYRYYMNEHLFTKINIDIRNTHLPDGMADDLEEEARKYEISIKEAGGIDLQLLGIGRSGHIGFNEPLSALHSRTRQKALTPTTLAQNGSLFDKPEDMPKLAMTMGVGTILDAKGILMLVTGEEKADILAKAVEGPVTSMISATALQLHPKCTVIVDEEAASKLKEKEYYRWIYENDPEWIKFKREN